MTLNKLSPELRQAFIELQQLIELEQLKQGKKVKGYKGYYYWERRKHQTLDYKTVPLRITIAKYLNVKDQAIGYMRYVYKLPIKTIMERTGYCKRSVLYHLKHSIQKIEQNFGRYKALKT